MANPPSTSHSRNYAIRGSVTKTTDFLVRFSGILAPRNRNSDRKRRKLNHNLSNLPDGSFERSLIDLELVIRRTKLGELGSTEVRQNQIW